MRKPKHRPTLAEQRPGLRWFLADTAHPDYGTFLDACKQRHAVEGHGEELGVRPNRDGTRAIVKVDGCEDGPPNPTGPVLQTFTPAEIEDVRRLDASWR